jgi:hypothetical protein
MDKVFPRFLEKFGGAIDQREVLLSSINRYQGKLPKLLLEYWAGQGWCGYGDGIFWIVNPQEYEGVVASWIEGTKLQERDTYHVIARSAFGDLYLFGEKTGFSLKISSVLSRYVINNLDFRTEEMDRHLQGFLLTREVDANNYGDLFKPAKKKLGTLRHDEMYGFVPALGFGGPDTLDKLEKVKAVEHLTLLSQIAELQPYSFSDL